ncbi:cytochrome P450 [Streptomyces sp. H27-D2]|uniref:cytochrome P450 n=1 Tax=Streptomyces sp. H27-D2 TaxID=3046304 RepID=UPI002DBBEE49|nr:cytochrome P450 [Streptomyces sp. H27-D2]MEC4020198.1 cytochrome P450 [Streptomyces sp. H27-D2]
MTLSATGGTNGRPARPHPNAAAYRHDPLAYLAAEFDDAQDVWRYASNRVCVAGPAAAREVMGNRRGTFAETSDFFHTRDGVFGPRAAQIEIGRAARALVRRRLDAGRADLPRLVGDRLAPTSSWPDAGNLLVREHLREVLLCRDAPERLHEAVDGIIARAVLAGARRRHSAMSRLRFRRRATHVLIREIRARRSAGVSLGVGEPRDLLDVVVAGAGPSAEPADLAEVYLSFLFATVGSIGFALGWSVHLLGTHPRTDGDEPGWIAREAMRLWPVAWLFSRTPSRAHDLAGVTVGPRDEVNVCSYLVHRHPRHWDRPDEFVPSRWAESVHDPAFIPFGFGPHTCAGATVTMALLEDLIRVITRDWHLSVTDGGDGPHLGPALAPPRFTAELHARVDSTERR